MKLLLSTTSRGPWRGPGQIRRQANPKGKPALRGQVDQTLPQDGAKSVNPAKRDSLFGSHFRRNKPSRGIRGESDNRAAVARRATRQGGGQVVKITEDVRKYAAEKGMTDDEALKSGVDEKSKEFVQTESEIYKQG